MIYRFESPCVSLSRRCSIQHRHAATLAAHTDEPLHVGGADEWAHNNGRSWLWQRCTHGCCGRRVHCWQGEHGIGTRNDKAALDLGFRVILCALRAAFLQFNNIAYILLGTAVVAVIIPMTLMVRV